jgi:anti-anti-sigma regulatory factor
VLLVQGDLDEITADTLESELVAVRDGKPVIVDLSETTFICSASIHVLTKVRREGRPALVVPNGQLAKVLDIVQANRTNRMFIDRDTAIQSMSLSRLAQRG